jgi:hypothetical protein
MINDETQDQDLQEEQKAMSADAKALLGKVHMTVPVPPPGDEWVAEAVKAVEASITKLIDEFRAQPFIHRVEHSLHARLMQLLSEWEHLRGWYPIGDSGFKTQLIHKEWPETKPRKKEPELDRRQAQGLLRRGCSRSQPAWKSNPRAVHRWSYRRSNRHRAGSRLLE